MSKKFEYELMLRLEKAEKAIASLASKIEKDLGNALNKVFNGSSEFDPARFTKNIGSRLEQDVSSALKQAFSGSSEFDFGKRVGASVEQEVKTALQSAFSGSSEFDFADPRAAEEASQKRIQQIKNESQTKNQIAEEDHRREMQRIDGEAAARKEADAAIRSRLQAEKELKDSATAEMYQRRQAESNIEKERQKAHDDKQKALEKLWGVEKSVSADRIAKIRSETKADEAAQAIRYEQHRTVLDTIKQARLQNASDLAAIEQRITTMTEAEAKQQLDAYRKTAKARVDYAIEAGYKLEADNARQAAGGARSVSAIFQVQQAIEDSMYAGLRGAGNNIAMLLTSISSGWLAIGGLIGIATLQLASHLGVFDKLNEAMDGALWKTKEQVRQEEYLARIRREDWERGQKQPIEAVDFDPRGKSVESAQEDTAAAEKKLAILKEQQEALQFSLVTFERLKDKANEVGAAFARKDFKEFRRLSLEYKEILDTFNAGKTGLDVKATDLSLNPATWFKTMFGDGVELSGGGEDELKKRWEDAGSAIAAAADEVAKFREQEEKVLEVQGRKAAQETLKEAALENIEAQIEASQAVVKSREDELQAIQKAVEASQRALEIEERRADAIRKAASARDDEFAKQKLGLENTILDMEANEKAKAAKDKAGSAEEKIKGQLAWAKQWAEQQAKIDKANNPQNGSNIAAAKDQWIKNQEQQAQAALDRIKKTEQAEIESAKKIAEEAKKANLDAMKATQMEKADRLTAWGRSAMWDDNDPRKAIEYYEEAQKTLKEVQNAEIANLKEKDSVQQGKDALKEIEALQEKLKELDRNKLRASEEAQQTEKDNILREMAREDQAAARLEQAKVAHDELLEKKQQINKVSLMNPNDLDSIGKFRRELEIIMGMLPRTGMGPMPAPGMGSPGGGSAGGTGGGGTGGGTGDGFPPSPTLPGGFSMTFNMNNASPNSVAAAANSIVQSQKAMAMLSGV